MMRNASFVAVGCVMACIFIAARCAVASAPKWHDLNASYSFQQFVNDFDKPYNADTEEWVRHRVVFESAMLDILQHNADSTQTYKKGVNRFTDMPASERHRHTSMFSVLKDTMTPAGAHHTTMLQSVPDVFISRHSTTPLSMDYRLHVPPVLTTVKDQGSCGSCWSFATTESIESQYALQYGKLHLLSEQQLVSCVPDVTVVIEGTNFTDHMHGCHGYLPNLAVDYLVEQVGGMTTEWMNPYTSYFKNHTEPIAKCRKSVRNVVNVTGYNYVESNDVEAFKRTLHDVGPIVVIMYVPESFASYESGIYADKACVGNKHMILDHAVLLVGYGRDMDLGKDYWIVRNSFGANWGEEGYFRLLREDTNASFKAACGVSPFPGSKRTPDGAIIAERTAACGTCGILAYGLVPKVG